MAAKEYDLAAVNAEALDATLRGILGTKMLGISFYVGKLTVLHDDVLTPEEETATDAAVAGHDPEVLTARQTAAVQRETSKADVLSKLRLSDLNGKSPDEIAAYFTTRINGWGSLANAKADLLVWLPLMAAGLVWLVAKKEEN